ncbi:TetR/AcrR family transcriptional regulator [Aquirhabdus parva]|uniref:TetR/AcrR family transcriptional regulator n=2 Tax=Aquirhabdus parva TaxID=2283318 RepID=A0A345P567_9GAMM|nr:TetR/AcrR family transcriptional regulator [Aquirhabdus parva]
MAALQIVNDEGADALTLRYLAKQLSSGTATLYRHFESREDLIAQVVDRVFAEMESSMPGIDNLGWEMTCRMLANHMFKVLCHHRGVAPLLLQSVPKGPNAMIQRERSLALLLANGFSTPLAVRAYVTLARYVLGFAVQLSDRHDEDRDNAQITATFLKLDRAAFPATFAVIDEFPIPLEEEFSFGLELMIAGLSQIRKCDLNQ